MELRRKKAAQSREAAEAAASEARSSAEQPAKVAELMSWDGAVHMLESGPRIVRQVMCHLQVSSFPPELRATLMTCALSPKCRYFAQNPCGAL